MQVSILISTLSFSCLSVDLSVRVPDVIHFRSRVLLDIIITVKQRLNHRTQPYLQEIPPRGHAPRGV